MDHSCIDIYITRDVDGYVVAPAGSPLPEDAMTALGGVVHGWMQQVGEAARLPGWRGVCRDIDACGYSVLSDEDFAALLLPGRGEAYTPDQQEACTPDAFRLCGPEIPDVDRITACMIRNRAQLSPACRVFFRGGPEPREASEREERRPAKRKVSRSHKAKKSTY